MGKMGSNRRVAGLSAEFMHWTTRAIGNTPELNARHIEHVLETGVDVRFDTRNQFGHKIACENLAPNVQETFPANFSEFPMAENLGGFWDGNFQI